MFISLTIVFIGGFRWGSGIMGVASASLNLKKGEIKWIETKQTHSKKKKR